MASLGVTCPGYTSAAATLPDAAMLNTETALENVMMLRLVVGARLRMT